MKNKVFVRYFSTITKRKIALSKIEEYKPPKWATHLKSIPKIRLPLARLPTPVHSWTFSFQQKDKKEERNLWIKRDDLTDFLLSGNKIRKLEFLLAEILIKGYDSVITIGGLNSNHCRAVAVASNMVGLESNLLLRTKEKNQQKSTILEGNMLLNQLVNANIYLVSRQEYAAHGQYQLLEILKNKLLQQGKNPYVIPVGGSVVLGSWGYIEAIKELEEQILQKQIPLVDDIAFACGSGGTAVGLSVGVKLSKLPIRVTGISVCDNASYFHNHCNEELKEFDLSFSSETILHVNDNYQGVGYSIATEEELKMLKDISQSSGIILDPTYTLKAVRGIALDPMFQNRKILFIHTGGTFGIYSYIQQMKDINLFSSNQVQCLF